MHKKCFVGKIKNELTKKTNSARFSSSIMRSFIHDVLKKMIYLNDEQ